MDKLTWIWSHRDAIAASMVAFATAYSLIVATPLSRIISRPPPSASWWKRALYDLCIDTPSWLAALEHSGILGGIFNLPGVPSRAPEANPSPAASRLMRMREGEQSSSVGDGDGGALLVLLLAASTLAMVAIACSGCGTAGGKALGACEMNTLPAQLEGTIAGVVAAALSPAGVDWTAQLEQAAASAGPGQGSCIVQAVAAWFEGLTSGHGEPAPAYAEAQRRLRAYLVKHPATACAPTRTLFGGGGAAIGWALQ